MIGNKIELSTAVSLLPERRPLTLAELRLLADACITEWPQLLRYYSERQILEGWCRLAEDHNLMVEGQRRQGR